jgi:hypothetical protein
LIGFGPHLRTKVGAEKWLKAHFRNSNTSGNEPLTKKVEIAVHHFIG